MIKVTFCFSINYFHLLISIVYSYLEFLEINSSHQLPFWTVFEFNSWPPALSVRLQQLCYIKIIDWDTCTVESKPVTQHDSCAVALLPLQSNWVSVWSDLAIFCTLTTINLLKSPTVLGNFCKGVKIYHFSGEIIWGQLFYTFGNFFWSHWWVFSDWMLPTYPTYLRNRLRGVHNLKHKNDTTRMSVSEQK